MKKAFFRFYGELNDFLPEKSSQTTVEHSFRGRPSVKDRIETLGIPHTEVWMVLAGGESVDFSYHVENGDQISVYPVFRSLPVPPRLAVRAPYEGEYRFVLDVHLGQLARYLRMFGFDALYRNDYRDQRLAETSATGKRILLTRDLGLLKRKKVMYGYYVRSDHPSEQIVEVLERYDLFDSLVFLGRCLDCNCRLEPVEKEEVLDRLEPRTKKYYDDFYRCPGCRKVFWRGSHFEEMQDFIESVIPEKYR